MRKFYCLLSVLLAILHQTLAIVGSGRDLVLTPKQALQLSGKRIYYEEQQPGAAARPWERTLKHVTYVTLFTDAAVGAASGNLSRLHEYHEFLQTPYVPTTPQSAQSASVRFGDIVTLASGRLEQLQSNGSFRFVEGSTAGYLDGQAGHPQAEQGIRTRALWRVQRIRHRDGDTTQRLPQRYHYEMKFSVSPLAASIGWPPQSFIQKEADYPQSFGRLVYEEKREQAYAQRRQDRQPQATFVRGIFQAPLPPPPTPPLKPNLNIGEYLKGVPEGPKGLPKLEIHPGLFNLGLRPNYIAATTFRPSYPHKFPPHPDLVTPVERYPLPDGGNSATSEALSVPGTPVTHHFHHHFYMTPNGFNENAHHPELGYRPTTYVGEQTTPAITTHQQHKLESEYAGEVRFPLNHDESSTESLETGEDQPPVVRSPPPYTEYGQASKYQTAKLPPLLIYAGGAAADGDVRDEHKSFVHSEPLEETIYRYSEPDPLYIHQHPLDVLPLDSQQNSNNQQTDQHQQAQPTEIASKPNDRTEQQSLAHEEEETEEEDHQQEQRPTGSQSQSTLATTTDATTTTTPTTTTTTTTTPAATISVLTNRAGFVSSSTTISPLRALSRYRTTSRITAGRSTTSTTTSTELPLIPKWKQRRRENITNLDSKAKSSHRYESKVIFPPTTSTTITTTTAKPTALITSNSKSSNNSSSTSAPLREIIEVLTQKSVSKSVSIKVGENGEEIPIIVDDDENEVKRS